jgi:DNA end-binding protein Ku
MLGTVLRYDYEVRDEKEVAGTVPRPKIPKEMLQLASHILDTMAGHFDPSRFKDEFEMELRKLVKRKASGKPIEYAERREKPSDVVDLMAALRQSVEGGKRSAPKPEGRCARGAVKPLANGRESPEVPNPAHSSPRLPASTTKDFLVTTGAPCVVTRPTARKSAVHSFGVTVWSV